MGLIFLILKQFSKKLSCSLFTISAFVNPQTSQPYVKIGTLILLKISIVTSTLSTNTTEPTSHNRSFYYLDKEFQKGEHFVKIYLLHILSKTPHVHLLFPQTFCMCFDLCGHIWIFDVFKKNRRYAKLLWL